MFEIDVKKCNGTEEEEEDHHRFGVLINMDIMQTCQEYVIHMHVS